MTIQEIKDIFNIDITEKNKQILNVYLRTLYTEKNRPNKTFIEIGNELNLTHATLLNCFYKLDLYKLDPLFMYVNKAFKTKDIALIHEFRRLSIEKIKERAKRTYDNKVSKLNKPKRVYKEKYVGEDDRISLDFLDAERVGILEVAENLRFKKTKLNDKPFPEWTGRDWKNYHKLINN